MTKIYVASTALKVVGIVLLVQSIVEAPMAAHQAGMFWHGNLQGYPGNMRAAGAIAAVLLGLFLLFWADGLARLVVKEPSVEVAQVQ